MNAQLARSIYNEMQQRVGPGMQKINEIQCGIYIGPTTALKELDAYNIKHVLTLATNVANCQRPYQFIACDITTNLPAMAGEKIYRFLRSVALAEEKVYIHDDDNGTKQAVVAAAIYFLRRLYAKLYMTTAEFTRKIIDIEYTFLRVALVRIIQGNRSCVSPTMNQIGHLLVYEVLIKRQYIADFNRRLDAYAAQVRAETKDSHADQIAGGVGGGQQYDDVSEEVITAEEFIAHLFPLMKKPVTHVLPSDDLDEIVGLVYKITQT